MKQLEPDSTNENGASCAQGIPHALRHPGQEADADCAHFAARVGHFLPFLHGIFIDWVLRMAHGSPSAVLPSL
jgi:hypothetical protein